jgi:hypothetical protein
MTSPPPTHFFRFWCHRPGIEGGRADIPAARKERTCEEVELPAVHQREEAYLTLRRTMVQRVHTAAGVLLGNLPKIQSQDLPSCMPGRLCLLILERPCSVSLGPPSLESSSSPLLVASSRSSNAISAVTFSNTTLSTSSNSAPGSSLCSGEGGQHG